MGDENNCVGGHCLGMAKLKTELAIINVFRWLLRRVFSGNKGQGDLGIVTNLHPLAVHKGAGRRNTGADQCEYHKEMNV